MYKRQNDFINFYQTIDILIIDDIQEFAGVTKTQNTFFHIFNHLHQNGKQLILTSDRAPVLLQGMEERLITRFKWGMVAELEKPTVEPPELLSLLNEIKDFFISCCLANKRTAVSLPSKKE